MQGQYSPGNAWLAAALMLVVSWTQLSFLGFAYQIFFTIWSTVAISSLGRRTSLEGHLALWICITCASAMISIAVWAIQILHWVIPQSVLYLETNISLLKYSGLIISHGGWNYVRGLALPFVATLVFGGQIHLIRKLIQQQRQDQQSSQSYAVRQSNVREGRTTNKGIFLGLSLMVTTISWPAVLSIPYALIIINALGKWSQARSTNIPVWQVWTVQGYCSFHLFALYLIQIPFFEFGNLGVYITTILGIFRISTEASQITFLSYILVVVGLHCLHAALGMYTTIAEKLEYQWQDQDSQYSPLLPERQERPSDMTQFGVSEQFLYTGRLEETDTLDDLSRPWDSTVTEVAQDALEKLGPYLVGQAYKAIEWLCSQPELAAAWLCLFSLLEPSMLAGLGMLLGLWVLLAPKKYGRKVLLDISPKVSEFAIAWFLFTYLLSCFARIVSNSQLIHFLQLIGIYVSSDPYPSPCAKCDQVENQSLPVFVPVVGLLFLVTVLCGVSRRSKIQQTEAARVDEEDRGEDEDNQNKTRKEVQQIIKLVGTFLIRMIWYLGFLLVPFTWFIVGVTKVDVLHALYLVFLLGNFGKAVYRFVPPERTALVEFPQHFFMRLYASCHIAAMYISMIGRREELWGTGGNRALSIIGLIGIDVVNGILPVMFSFLVATFHSRAGEFLDKQWEEKLQSRIEEVGENGLGENDTNQRHGQFFVWFSSVVVSFGASLVVFVGYFLIIYGYNIGLLGLGYLILILILFMYPPVKSYYKERSAQQASDTQSPRVEIVEGSWMRWFPMVLLSLFASFDLIVQYLIMTLLPLNPTSNSSLYLLLNNIIGLYTVSNGEQASTAMLVSVLIRPALFLGIIKLYRFMFALDMDANERKNEKETTEQKIRRRIKAQNGYGAFVKRLLILHCGKLIILFAFAAIMQHPGIIGMFILFGILVVVPSLAGPIFNHRKWLFLTSLVVMDVTMGFWMIAEYAFQIEIIREKVFGGWNSGFSQKVEMIGLSREQSSRSNLESALRYKCLAIIAIGAKFLAYRWLNSIPSQIRIHAPIGQACPLFWPPPGFALVQQPSDEDIDANQTPSVLRPITRAFKNAWKNVRKCFLRIIKKRVQEEKKVSQADRRRQYLRGFSGMSRRWRNALLVVDLLNTQEEASGPKWQRQLRLLVEAIRELVQQFWSDWGIEVCLVTLLISAFLLLNCLSLVLMILVVLGMVIPAKQREVIWRVLNLPVLAIFLLYQYAILLRHCWTDCSFKHESPSQYAASSTGKDGTIVNHNETQYWLGLYAPDWLPSALWGLMFAFLFCVVQVSYEKWIAQPKNLNPKVSLSMSANSEHQGLPQDKKKQVGSKLWQRINDRVISFRPVETRQDVDLAFQQIWSPMEYSNRAQWTTLDWLRFLVYRNSVDIVLIAVAALCFVVQNFVHLLYLVFVLYYYRRRKQLFEQGNKEFRYLPVLNFIIMFAYLVYQAPLGIWFDVEWIMQSPSRQQCTLDYVIGIRQFFTVSPDMIYNNTAFQMSITGASIDIILWLVLRIQTRMFASGVYTSVKECVEKEQEEEQSILKEKKQMFLEQQADTALRMGNMREERKNRIKALKEGLFKEEGLDITLIDGQSRQKEEGTFLDEENQQEKLYLLNDEEQNMRLSIRARSSTNLQRVSSPTSSWQLVQNQNAKNNVSNASKDFYRRSLSSYYTAEEKDLETFAMIARRETEKEKEQENYDKQEQDESQNQQQENRLSSEITAEVTPFENAQNVEIISLSQNGQLDHNFTFASSSQTASQSERNQYQNQSQQLFEIQVQEEAQQKQQNVNHLQQQQEQQQLSLFQTRQSKKGPQPIKNEIVSDESRNELRQQVSFAIKEEQDVNEQQEEEEEQKKKESWLKRLQFIRTRRVKDSTSCYLLYFVIFVTDMSLLSVTFLISLLGYALITQSVSRIYWKIVLLISEIALVLMYAYLVPSTLQCTNFLSWAQQHGSQEVGFHSNAIACLPIFLVYLATLMHAQKLDRFYAGTASKAFNRNWGKQSDARMHVHWLLYLPQMLWRFISWICSWIFSIFTSTVQLLYRISSTSETGPSWVKVTLNIPESMNMNIESQETQHYFQIAFQDMIDKLQLIDICKRYRKRSNIFFNKMRPHPLKGTSTYVPELVQILPTLDEHRSLINLSDISKLNLSLQQLYRSSRNEDEVVLLFQVEALYQTSQRGLPGWPQRSINPAKHALQAFQRIYDYQVLTKSSDEELIEDTVIVNMEEDVTETPMMLKREEIPVEYPPPDLISRRVKSVYTKSMRSRQSSAATNQEYLIDSTSSTRTNVPFIDTSTNRFGITLGPQQKEELRGFLFANDPEDIIRITHLEHFSRIVTDPYAIVLAFDFLTFLLVAFGYQSVLSSPTSSIADITGEQVLPIKYLLTLMILFFLMVADRVIYSLGSHFGKVVLYFFQIAVFCYFTIHYYWLDGTTDKGKWVLRGVMALKLISLYCQAGQIKQGYPPRASLVAGRGRSAYYFYRHSDIVHYFIYVVFQNIPFMYELRILLDWACTPTTMALMDWYKLEDIRRSLYEREADLKMRNMRQLGDKQMLYIKLLMGGFLFFIILILLWMPLLLFSNFNPSNTVPDLIGVDVTMSLQSSIPAQLERGKHTIQNYELFESNSYFSVQPWFKDDGMPYAFDYYQSKQFQLICQTEYSAASWEITPPMQDMLMEALVSQEIDINLVLDWEFTRDAPPSAPPRGPVCSKKLFIPLANLTRQNLHEALNSEETGSSEPIQILRQNLSDPIGGIQNLFGLYWRLQGDQCSVQISDELVWVGQPKPKENVNCSMVLQKTVSQRWWQLSCQQTGDDPEASGLDTNTCSSKESGPMIVALLELVTGSGFIGQTLTSLGITGLYFGVVLTTGRVFRTFVLNIRMNIPFYDFPSVDRLVALCQDIYIARATKELMLEEELYYSILNIYRQPATLYELTKKKQT